MTTAKVAEEFNQSNENNDTKKGIQHTTSDSLKEKMENKVMLGQYIRSVDSLLVEETHSYSCRGEM